MLPIATTDLQGIIYRGEGRNIEYKPAFDWEDENSLWLRYEVIKTVIAMSNTPGGGDILLGTVKTKSGYDFPGVSSKLVHSYERLQEDVERHVHKYCMEPATFSFHQGSIEIEDSTRQFLVVRVQEFEVIPILSADRIELKKKDGTVDKILEKDALYVRSRKAIWSSQKASGLEFRDVIQLAARKYIEDLAAQGFVPQEKQQLPDFKAERSDYE